MSAIADFRKYRATVTTAGVPPVGFLEWALGRIAGRLIVTTAKMAKKRGDTTALNHTLLALWAGDTSKGGHLAGRLAPAELSRARKDGRLRLVVDPEPAPSTVPAP
jgi:hypothetical protein